MDNSIAQQLNYASLFFNMRLQDGPSVWDMSGNEPTDTIIQLGNTSVSGSDMNYYCVQCKRQEKYPDAIGGYIKSFGASYEKHKKLPISTLRGFVKVLISVNAFEFAFDLAGTALADLQQNPNANQQEVQLFTRYWSDLGTLSRMIVDNNDFSQLKGWCANYSGNPNYRLVKTQSEIKNDFQKIRDKLRQVYGN